MGFLHDTYIFLFEKALSLSKTMPLVMKPLKPQLGGNYYGSCANLNLVAV